MHSVTEVMTLDRRDRVRIAAQLVALSALLAEFELWPGRSALRRATVELTETGVRARLPDLPLSLSRLWSGLGGGDIAAEVTKSGVLDSIAALTGLEPDLFLLGGPEPGFFLDGVLERLLAELPRPLDPVTARSLWMIHWSCPPDPEPGDTNFYEILDRTTGRRLGSALWSAAVRRGAGASLEVVAPGEEPSLVVSNSGDRTTRIIVGQLHETLLGELVERSKRGDEATVALGRFPEGWNPPPAPVFDQHRLGSHLAMAGITAARRLHRLDGMTGRFDPLSKQDRLSLTRSASYLWSEPPRRHRGRFGELTRVAGLLPEGVPVDRACELAAVDRECVDEAEKSDLVIVRKGTVALPEPRAATVDPLHGEILDLFPADDPRELLHRALATGDTGELLVWARERLDDLDAWSVRHVLSEAAADALGAGVQAARVEACLCLMDVHGARRALEGLGHEMARPWSAWLQYMDRAAESEILMPRSTDLRHAPRACAEVGLFAVRRAVRWGAENAADPVDLVRGAIRHLGGGSRRWVEIRLAAQVEPSKLEDRQWRRSMAAGHPELVGLLLVERSARAAMEGRPRHARRLLERAIGAERAPGRLALMLINLGGLELDEGRSAASEIVTLGAYRLFQAAGYRHRTWEVLHTLAVADIDQLRVARAGARLDAISEGNDNLFVAVERTRLALAVGDLEHFRTQLDRLPHLDAVADPRIVEALSFLHGARELLFGTPSTAAPLLRNGGQEAHAWLHLSSVLGDMAGPGAGPAEDGWGVHRAAELVREARGAGFPMEPESLAREQLDLEDAVAVALCCHLAVRKGWPGRAVRERAAAVLSRHGLTGWASLVRWGGEAVEGLLEALSVLTDGRGPGVLSERQWGNVLWVLGVGGLLVRSSSDGRTLWRVGDGEEYPGRVHSAIELVPLGSEPIDGFGWKLVADLLEQAYPVAEVERTSRDETEVRLDGVSPAIERLKNEVRAASTTRFTVLVHGETGSGKEVVAREIHRLSERAGDLVSVNVAAIPTNLLEAELFGSVKGAFTGADRSRRGLVSAADGGTLFLDEVGDLDPALQVKLLRFLEGGEVRPVGSDRSRILDVRVICATHRNLDRRVREGRFRRDLYYRMAVAKVSVPPLRERREDIPVLRTVFEREASRQHGLPVSRWTRGAAKALANHDWPGNVRELKHTVEVAMARAAGEPIRPDHLPMAETEPVRRATWDVALAEFKRRLITEVLTRHAGNRSAAARELGISRQALLYQLKSLNLNDL
jgi:DNA-binding NtrC family response regulator